MECVLVLMMWRIFLVARHRLFSPHEDSLMLCEMKTFPSLFQSLFSPDDDRMSRTSNRSDTTFVFANSVKDENSLRRSVGRNTKVIFRIIVQSYIHIIDSICRCKIRVFPNVSVLNSLLLPLHSTRVPLLSITSSHSKVLISLQFAHSILSLPFPFLPHS